MPLNVMNFPFKNWNFMEQTSFKPRMKDCQWWMVKTLRMQILKLHLEVEVSDGVW